MQFLLNILICVTSIGRHISYSLDFNRDYLGVVFSPHVRSKEAGPLCGEPSELEDLVTMSELICTKFSRILTSTVDANREPYRKNYTYYHSTCARARIAEAAALVNRNQERKCLSVLIGIFYQDSQQMNTEVNVAVEAAYLANSIFPGTVEGFVFSQFDMHSLDWAKSTLKWMEALRNLTNFSDFKIGTTQFWTAPYGESPGSKAYQISELRKEMIIKSDIIVCDGIPAEQDAQHGAKYSFTVIKNWFMRARTQIQALNSKIEVIWLTFWNSYGDKEWENVENFYDYWKEPNKFAGDENYSVFLRDAFDAEGDSLGWWKLLGDDLIHNPAGYVEKIEYEEWKSNRLHGISEQSAYLNHSMPDPKKYPSQRDQINSSGARYFYLVEIVIFVGIFQVQLA